MNYLKEYFSEFCRCDFELAHLFGTKKLLAKIDYKLPEAETLAEPPIDELVQGYVYLQKNTNKKDFFWVLDKNLIPTRILQKFISNAANADTLEHVKIKFIGQLQWYLEERN